MGYRVIKAFADLQDGGHRYKVGDAYPREGATVTDRRLGSLLSADNRQKTPLIAEVKVEVPKVTEIVVEEKAEPKTEAKPKRVRKNKES